jgi:hypothetical protein
MKPKHITIKSAKVYGLFTKARILLLKRYNGKVTDELIVLESVKCYIKQNWVKK